MRSARSCSAVVSRHDSMADHIELCQNIDRLLDQPSSKQDTEDDNYDSDSLIEAVHSLAPEDLRAGDQEPIDDEVALRGSGDEHEETDCCNQTSPEYVHCGPPVTQCSRRGIQETGLEPGGLNVSAYPFRAAGSPSYA